MSNKYEDPDIESDIESDGDDDEILKPSKKKAQFPLRFCFMIFFNYKFIIFENKLIPKFNSNFFE